MEKKKGKKGIIIAIVATVLVLAGALTTYILLNKKADVYRLLKVFEFEGSASIDREGVGAIEPYANMVLESGDRISLDTGKMTLQADEDKFIFLEEQTELVLKASGSSSNSKTEIELIKGAVTNDIKNKLSTDSSYEINTPNSTMSVRGTIYRVHVYEENGIKYTRVSVFDGKVTTRLVYKDGTVADEEVEVEKGKEVIIYEDSTITKYLYPEPQDIDYDTLPEDVLRRLMGNNDEGREVSITNPEIEIILEGPYTVTFYYNNSIFGTQTVKKGKKAVVPNLQPAESGSWQFDFDTPIEKNTDIEWK
ncbi:MAG: FecR domain-containing protein [Eubacterium sp.]|nr:FecR domain-containing protein [Eubacterium sp.]